MERNTILIVDDAEVNRSLLHAIFEEQYEIIEAEDGEAAIKEIDENHDRLVLILLDLVMPNCSGLGVLEHMRQNDYMDSIPVIMITGNSTADTDLQVYEYGTSDIIYKPFVSKVVKKRAENIIELFSNRRNIEKQLEIKTKKLEESRKKLASSNEFLINALSSVIEFRSSESGEHIKRVRYFTRIFLNALCKFYPEYELTKEQVDLIVNASALHDLGKIAIPDSILLKPARLTPDEYEVMKTHSMQGAKLLERFKQDDSEFYRYCYDICRYHHERYDGGGYPDGLIGEEIPIWAQIVSIVDVYDALVSKRVYKTAYAADTSIDMIMNGECGQFSPKMLRILDEVKSGLIDLTEAFPFTDFNSIENGSDIEFLRESK